MDALEFYKQAFCIDGKACYLTLAEEREIEKRHTTIDYIKLEDKIKGIFYVKIMRD